MDIIAMDIIMSKTLFAAVLFVFVVQSVILASHYLIQQIYSKYIILLLVSLFCSGTFFKYMFDIITLIVKRGVWS